MQEKLKYSTKVADNGLIQRWISLEIKKFFELKSGKDVIIEIKEGRIRTNNQNEFLWGCVYEVLLTHCKSKNWQVQSSGGIMRGLTKDDIHIYFMELMGYVNFVIDGSGRAIRIGRESSTKLTTKQFEDYIEKLRAWGTDKNGGNGLILPFPNENINN